MLKQQKGFSALEIILLVALVAVIGFAGWTWHQANNNLEQIAQEENKDQRAEGEFEEAAEAEELTISECSGWLSQDDPQADTWTRNLQNSEASDDQVGVYSITELCELSDGSKTLTYKQDRTATNDSIPPAIAVFDSNDELKKYNSLKCRALGGEGARLFVTSVNDESITAECRSGHLGQSSVQTFSIDRDTLDWQMIDDQYEE